MRFRRQLHRLQPTSPRHVNSHANRSCLLTIIPFFDIANLAGSEENLTYTQSRYLMFYANVTIWKIPEPSLF